MGTIVFFQLPPAVRVLVIVMLWPAIWAGALLIVAFTGDMLRHSDLDREIAFAEMADEAIAALDLQRANAKDAVRAELPRQPDAVERGAR